MTRREKLKAALSKIGCAIAASVSFRDLLLLVGLVLVGYGLSLVWLPAAFLVPGGVIAAVAIFGVR